MANEKWSVHDQIYISAAAVYTNSMYFFDSTTTPTRKANILKAYTSASSYINLILSYDTSHNYILYAPNYSLKILSLSCCLILKVLRSSYSTEVDFEEGKKLCNQACIAAMRSSVDPQDSAAKFAKMTAQLWHSRDMRVLREPPVLMVKSRLGARCVSPNLLFEECSSVLGLTCCSILFDYIWTWRQEFGGQPEAYPRSNTGEYPLSFSMPLPFPTFSSSLFHPTFTTLSASINFFGRNLTHRRNDPHPTPRRNIPNRWCFRRRINGRSRFSEWSWLDGEYHEFYWDWGGFAAIDIGWSQIYEMFFGGFWRSYFWRLAIARWILVLFRERFFPGTYG